MTKTKALSYVTTTAPMKCDSCGEKAREFTYEYLDYAGKWKRKCRPCNDKLQAYVKTALGKE